MSKPGRQGAHRAAQATCLVLWPLLVLLALGLAPLTTWADPLELAGQLDPGTPGLNAMAVGLDTVAYLGSWGTAGNCPGFGVRVIDIHEPEHPRLMGAAAAYRDTTAEHLAVARLDTPAFRGTLLLAGIQRCSTGGGEGGLALWDVSDPANPREVGFFSTGRVSRGVHELALSHRGDQWLAYLAVANSEVGGGDGDLRVVDVTDPAQPVGLAAWGAERDAGLRVGYGAQCAPACRGTIAQAFLHSVALSADGQTAYLSYWDLGVLILDVRDPTRPVLLGRFAEEPTAEGNTHSVALAGDGSLALVADETFRPPWGRLRLVDVRDPTNPAQVGTFDTSNSAAQTPGADERWYSIHNPVVDDRDPSRAYLAWYADGVRLVDVHDPSALVEVAAWVPPVDPMVWSALPVGDLVLVGDVNGGLYILRR